MSWTSVGFGVTARSPLVRSAETTSPVALYEPIGPPQNAIVGVTRLCHVGSTPMSAQSLPMPASPVLELILPKSIRTGVSLPTAPMTVAVVPAGPQWPAVLIEYEPGEP